MDAGSAIAGLKVLGVPTSAGAFAPGQEQAPAALRAAGLIGRLGDAGLDVEDMGDSSVWRWRPDPDNPRAQNRDAVAATAAQTAARVERAVDGDRPLLLLGGDCTVELGTVAGHLARSERMGLIYFDVHPDLNTPQSVHEGAFDWMGVAHMLGVEGADPVVRGFGPRDPLLDDEQILLFSWGAEQATIFEREQIEARGLEQIPLAEVASDPSAAARRALEGFGARFERLLIHFDVDTIDFTDAPLSENTGRNEGLSLDAAFTALSVLLASERLNALTITELNPLHGAEDGATLERFAAALAGALGRAVARPS
jgi:arginase